MKYRKKPVVIEAVQFTTNNQVGSPEMDALVEWMNSNGATAWHDGTDIYIGTREGEMRAGVGDWIIRGTKGEFYPCKPDVFAEVYEHVEE